MDRALTEKERLTRLKKKKMEESILGREKSMRKGLEKGQVVISVLLKAH